MLTITICPHCQSEIKHSDAHIGRRITCPECGKKVIFVGGNDVDDDFQFDDVEKLPRQPLTSTNSPWPIPLLICAAPFLFIAGAVVVMLVVVGAIGKGFLAFLNSLPPPPQNGGQSSWANGTPEPTIQCARCMMRVSMNANVCPYCRNSL